MNAGIDFGTSTCSIGIWRDDQPALLNLEGESTRLTSALHTSRQHMAVATIDEKELRQRIAEAKRAQSAKKRKGAKAAKALTDEQLESRTRGIMRREVAQAAAGRLAEPDDEDDGDDGLYADAEVTFGEAAIVQHLLDPQRGYFVKSPKSFLGADIKQQHIDLFTEIITRMLAHIKHRAEAQVEGSIDAICLGRPVRFHGLRGEDGNRQAVAIMEAAAVAAGFDHVEFLFEPIAAALDYERGIARDVIALVLDAGGGTTDCSMVRIGPSHREKTNRIDSVLGYSGDRIGGTDIDIKLAIRKIMPYFGKDTLLKSGLPVPSPVFWNAVTITDVNALAQFASAKTGREIDQLVYDAQEPRKLRRLQTLYEGRHNYRLNRSSEQAKIALSDQEAMSLPLEYIEDDLLIPLTRRDLRESVERELEKFVELMKDVERQAQTAPDVIYVTGGTAKSPMIEECIRSNFGGVEIVVGDLFGSVTSGLATWAHRTFR